MKNYRLILAAITSLFLFSCEDWLLDAPLATTTIDEYFSSGQAAISNVNGAYVPLQWEYNYTYYSEWFIGDITSDDALKGGQNLNDMADAYDMENFKTISNNGLLLDYYRAQYQGISRCNVGLKYIPEVFPDSIMTENVQTRLIGELKFLRALYYFRLVRVFGGVPYVDFVIDSSSKWRQLRASKDDVYKNIIKDLEDANLRLWKKSEYSDEDMGRATKGAAQAMLLKANLYMKNYTEAKRWGDSILISNAGEYELATDYNSNFTLAGENGIESVFEIQYMEDGTSDYGGKDGEGGNGYTRGTFTLVLTRSRSSVLGGGWGFNKPTQDLYDEFESGDPRREATIYNPKDSEIENPAQEIYLGCRYLTRKYTMYDDLPGKLTLHASRGPLNYKVIRYADVLLMYAEACCETNNLSVAKNTLNKVRERARGNDPDILPAFPYGSYSDNQTDLRKAIYHERRVELAMEGHRWFDLCRWENEYGVFEVMETYREKYIKAEGAQMAPFERNKNELVPSPSEEREINPSLTQNPGYN